MHSQPDSVWDYGYFHQWLKNSSSTGVLGPPLRKYSARSSDESYMSNSGEGLMMCVIKKFDPRSKAWCLRSPGRGEISVFLFLSQDIILFLLQIQFSVHVFGTYNGTISFSVREEVKGAQITLPMWERAGSWSDHWFLITLPMPVLQNR